MFDSELLFFAKTSAKKNTIFYAATVSLRYHGLYGGSVGVSDALDLHTTKFVRSPFLRILAHPWNYVAHTTKNPNGGQFDKAEAEEDLGTYRQNYKVIYCVIKV